MDSMIRWLRSDPRTAKYWYMQMGYIDISRKNIRIRSILKAAAMIKPDIYFAGSTTSGLYPKSFYKRRR